MEIYVDEIHDTSVYIIIWLLNLNCLINGFHQEYINY